MSKYRPRPPETPARNRLSRLRSRRLSCGGVMVCSLMSRECLRAAPGAIRNHPGPTLNATLVPGMAEKTIAENRRARHDYQLLERLEAGLVLTGTEVKSLRAGRTTMGQAYADIRDGEAWLQ